MPAELLEVLRRLDDALVTEDGAGVKYVVAGAARDSQRRAWLEGVLGQRIYVELPASVEEAVNLRYDALLSTSPSDRAEALMEASDFIDDNEDDIARLISYETGKSLSLSRSEVEAAQAMLQQAYLLVSSRGSASQGALHPELEGDWRALQLGVPGGVSLVLPPFTSPFFGAVAGAAASLAAGMPAVIKAPWQAPASALAAAAAIRGTDLGDYVSVLSVRGPGALVGQRFSSVVLFGRRGTESSVRRVFGEGVVANCSGRAAVLLCSEPEDVESLARGIVDMAVANAGQACGSTRWVLTTRSLAGDLLDSMADYAEQLSYGNPLDGKEVGPLRSRGLVDRAFKVINDAVSKGAELLVEPQADGNYMRPVVLGEVPKGAEVMWSDVLAPMVAVSEFDSCAEAQQVLTMMGQATTVIVYGGLSSASAIAESRPGYVVWGRDEAMTAVKAICHSVGDPAEHLAHGPRLPFRGSSLLLF